MIIEGQKWACEACVRGHRVSTCQHADRVLVPIAKKGRPVSQCHHCRGLRKSRSAHVKCDCAENHHNKHQCPHAEMSDSKGELLGDASEVATVPNMNAADETSCCCSHGKRCSCALKKDPLDPVPELTAPATMTPPSTAPSKPRLTTTHSDDLLTFSNGHHKPIHKHHYGQQKCQKKSAPYSIPNFHPAQGKSDIASRSVDSLPATNTFLDPQDLNDANDFVGATQQSTRLIKTEHNTPEYGPVLDFDTQFGQLPPLDLSSIGYSDFTEPRASNNLSAVSNASLDQLFPEAGYQGAEVDGPIFSAGIAMPSTEWPAQSESPFDHSFDGSPLKMPAYDDFDSNVLVQPAPSNASSGEISEVDDLTSFSGPSPSNPPSLVQNAFASDSSEICESDYRLSADISSVSKAQLGMLASSSPNDWDIDDFLNGVNENNGIAPFGQPAMADDLSSIGYESVDGTDFSATEGDLSYVGLRYSKSNGQDLLFRIPSAGNGAALVKEEAEDQDPQWPS